MQDNKNNNIIKEEAEINKKFSISELDANKTYAFVRKIKVVKKDKTQEINLSKEVLEELEKTLSKKPVEDIKTKEEIELNAKEQEKIEKQKKINNDRVIRMKKDLFTASPGEKMDINRGFRLIKPRTGEYATYQDIKEYARLVKEKWTYELSHGMQKIS